MGPVGEGYAREGLSTMVGGLCLVASATFVYVRLGYGVDLTDESFYVALPRSFALGHRPLRDEIALHQFGGLLVKPLLDLRHALLDSSTGLVLFVRRLYFSYALLCAAVVTRSLSRRIGAGFALAVAACGLAYVPFAIPSLSYNTLACFGLLAGLFLLGSSRDSRRPAVDLFLGTLFLASATLAYPALVPVTLPASAFAVWLLHRARPCMSTARLVAPGLAAGTLAASWLVGVFVVHGDAETIGRLLDFNAALAKQGGGVSKLAGLGRELGAELPHLGALVVIFAGVALGLSRGRSRLAVFSLALLTGPALLVASLLHEPFTEPGTTTPFVVLVLALGALAASTVDWRGVGATRDPSLLFVCAASVAAGLCIVWATANGWRNGALGFLPAGLVGLALLARRAAAGDQALGRPRGRWAFLVLAASLLWFQLLDLYSHVYRDAPIGELSFEIEHGAYAGLRTTPVRGRAIAQMERDLAEVGRPGDSLLVHDYFPAGYLMSDLRPRTPAIWMFPSAPAFQGNQAIRSIYATHFLEPCALPEVVMELRVRPVGRGAPLPMEPDDPVRVVLARGHYETLVRRPAYVIRRRAVDDACPE